MRTYRIKFTFFLGKPIFTHVHIRCNSLVRVDETTIEADGVRIDFISKIENIFPNPEEEKI